MTWHFIAFSPSLYGMTLYHLFKKEKRKNSSVFLQQVGQGKQKKKREEKRKRQTYTERRKFN